MQQILNEKETEFNPNISTKIIKDNKLQEIINYMEDKQKDNDYSYHW
jgi:hypothetical protein